MKNIEEYQNLALQISGFDAIDKQTLLADSVTGLCFEVMEMLMVKREFMISMIPVSDSRNHLIRQCGDVCFELAKLCAANDLKFEEVFRMETGAKFSFDLYKLLESIGKLSGMTQKIIQGYVIPVPKLIKEMRVVYFNCYAMTRQKVKILPLDIMQENIEKLSDMYQGSVLESEEEEEED